MKWEKDTTIRTVINRGYLSAIAHATESSDRRNVLWEVEINDWRLPPCDPLVYKKHGVSFSLKHAKADILRAIECSDVWDNE